MSTTRMSWTGSALLAASLLVLPTAAGSADAAGSANAAGSETVAITGATVHTGGAAGTLAGATVLLENGRIRAVGKDVAIPAGAKRIDAAGKVVTAGFFDSLSHLGIVEVNAVTGTRDTVSNDPRITAGFDVADAVNPRSTLIPINRVEGITRAVVAPVPGKSLFAGQGALIHLGHGDLVFRNSVALFASLGEAGAKNAGGARGAALLTLREAFEDAKDYAANRAAVDRGDRRSYSLSRLDLQAILPVLRGEKPLVVTVHRASDITTALKLAREYHLKLVLAGATEAWMVGKEIAAAHVPVLLTPESNLPGTFERLGATLENAARLHKAGVTVAFMSGEAHNSRNLKQEAGNAVAYGLPWDDALAALTLNPARIWGVADRIGTLEAGKEADVVIWTGDPFELSTYAEHVFIRGAEMPQDTRQTRLRDRYLNTQGGIPPVYRKPGS